MKNKLRTYETTELKECINYSKCPVRQYHRTKCDGFGRVEHDSSNKHLGKLILNCEDYRK